MGKKGYSVFRQTFLHPAFNRSWYVSPIKAILLQNDIMHLFCIMGNDPLLSQRLAYCKSLSTVLFQGFPQCYR